MFRAMKTRTTFEPKDFDARGQYVVRQNAHVTNISYLTSVAYKVGYGYSQGVNKKVDYLISLADGLSIQFDSIEKLCDHLNQDKIGFRPLTRDELIAIADWQGNRF